MDTSFSKMPEKIENVLFEFLNLIPEGPLCFYTALKEGETGDITLMVM